MRNKNLYHKNSVLEFSIAVKRHYDQVTFIRKTFCWGGSLTISVVQSIIIIVGSMEACRQTTCWRGSWDYCILQATGSRLWHWVKLKQRRPQSLLQQCPTSFKKATLTSARSQLPVVPLPMSLLDPMEPITLKLLQAPSFPFLREYRVANTSCLLVLHDGELGWVFWQNYGMAKFIDFMFNQRRMCILQQKNARSIISYSSL